MFKQDKYLTVAAFLVCGFVVRHWSFPSRTFFYPMHDLDMQSSEPWADPSSVYLALLFNGIKIIKLNVYRFAYWNAWFDRRSRYTTRPFVSPPKKRLKRSRRTSLGAGWRTRRKNFETAARANRVLEKFALKSVWKNPARLRCPLSLLHRRSHLASRCTSLPF